VSDNHFNEGGSLRVDDETIHNLTVTVTAGSSLDSLTVNGGNGNDTVTLGANVLLYDTLTVTVGNGTNVVSLAKGAVIEGSFFVTAGQGKNTVTLTSATVGQQSNSFADLEFGTGADAVNLTNSAVNNALYIEGGTVSLAFNNAQVGGEVQAGGNAMTAVVDGNSTIAGDVKLSTVSGADAITLGPATIGGGLTVGTGTSTGSITVTNATINTSTFISGTGKQTITINGSTLYSPDIDYGGAPIIDPITIVMNNDQFPTGLIIATGNGTASITITGSSIGQPGSAVIIQTGYSDATVVLGVKGAPVIFNVGGARFEGGPGDNTLTLTYAEFPAGPPIISNFNVVS
jgi:hypothetical protein